MGYGLLSIMNDAGLINPPYQNGIEAPMRTMPFTDFAHSFVNETEKWNAVVDYSTPVKSLESVLCGALSIYKEK